MHAVISNGSPRVRKYSNTDKIIEKFTAGMCENGSTFELYSISNRQEWAKAGEAFQTNDNIIIALPLYVECIPGLLMEFLETLTPRDGNAKLAFILQSGFAEGIQLRCGEEYLQKLAGLLGCVYGGTLVRGDNFSIRLFEGKERERITEPYRKMGRIFGRDGNFFSEECRKFTGPEVFPPHMRMILSLVFRTVGRKMFDKKAAEWGCTQPLDAKPYQD